MRRGLRFVLVQLGGLALLTLVSYLAITNVTRQWSERDLQLRSDMAVSVTQRRLVANWEPGSEKLAETLRDITGNVRILGVAACSMDGSQLAATDAYPAVFSCASIAGRIAGADSESGEVFRTTEELASGHAQMRAVTLRSGSVPVGVLLIVQDVEFIRRRDHATRATLLGVFVVMAMGASMVTLFASRTAWRGWPSEEQRESQEDSTEELRPREDRARVDRLERRRQGRPWDAERLRATLRQHLQGERIVVLANREPYIHEYDTDGNIKVMHPASGLVSALEPVMRACSGVWVAHGSGSADRETVDGKAHVRVPPGEESYTVRRVWLNEDEENGYYYGFANEGLWPLCHVADARPTFRAENWDHYVGVNRRFADAVCEEVDSDDPIILVQDYHFALAPRMIRERLPRATIITFWHIPWPSAERIGICPWSEELITGLLGSSIIGFHTRQHCNNFFDSIDAFVESRIDREDYAVVQGSRRTLVRAYPISIEWPVHWLKFVPPVADCRRDVRSELGLAEDTLIGVGVDRLDYTKGIEERLQAVDTLLEHYPEFRGRFVFVQLAAPSRTKIDRYRDLNERIEALTAEINAKWATDTYHPIVLRRAHHEPTEVFRNFRAAEVCYVGSLHDGMNLTAKEFVAARDDERGVLVLSQFTGAARDLTEALIVNPYDLREAADALAAALRMPPEEQRERMRAMRRTVSEFNVYRWAGRMLIDAAELRRRERITGRLSTSDHSARAMRA